jgi:urease accessory protein
VSLDLWERKDDPGRAFEPDFCETGYEVAVVTNDIYTQEDAEFCADAGAAAGAGARGGDWGCPHSAIRDDASMNLEAVRDLERLLPGLQVILIEAGGQSGCLLQPGAGRPLDLCDRRGGRRQDPAEGGPGNSRSDPLVINKIDLAPTSGPRWR